MRPLLGSSSALHSEKLEDAKNVIKCLLIANSLERVTLDQLPKLLESDLGESIPFKDFNFCSLKEFLLSIPDSVSLSFDKNTNQTYVYPVESSKTKHISSLISRQRKPKKQKLERKPAKLHSNSVDPILLKRLMLKLLNVNKCIKKVDLLSDIQAAIIDVCSLYSIRDLNSQLNELNHILTHDDSYIYLKSENLLHDFVKQKTKDRLRQLLTEKYPEGIWCEQLPDVYRKEYRTNLEYRDLGFNDIREFIAAASLPSHNFQCLRPANSYKYKVVSTDMPLKSVPAADSFAENDVEKRRSLDAAALPTHPASTDVSRRFIPKEFMNFDDSVEKIIVDTILDKSNVIVSEICNPSCFWIILHRNKHKLIKFMDNLEEFYLDQDLDKYRIPPIVLKPGLHVACIYSKRWHRGRIIKIADSNSMIALVQFYDYGTSKAYKANNLYFLHKKFCKLPAQAIPCCLFNIKPTAATSHNQWTEVAIEKFQDRAIEKDFVVSIHSRNQDNSITVDLIDTSTRNTVNSSIAQWMVSHDLASWGSISGKKTINVNKISSSEEQQQQYSNYIRPAKQLEALQKYKTRFELLEKNLPIEEKKEDSVKVVNCSIDDKSSKMQEVTDKSITETLKKLEKLIMFKK